MPTSERIFQELKAALREAATKPHELRRRRGTLRLAVIANLNELLALRDAGYSDVEIAEIFRTTGFAISAGTLKTYVNSERAARLGPRRSANSRILQKTFAGVGTTATNPRASEVAPKGAGTNEGARMALRHRLSDDDV